MKVNKFLKKLYYNNDCLYDGVDYIEINYPYNRLGDIKQLRISSMYNVNNFLQNLKTLKNELWYKQKIEGIAISVNSYDRPIIIIRTKYEVDYEYKTKRVFHSKTTKTD